jgi:branched-chain amino acid transport system permease protein
MAYLLFVISTMVILVAIATLLHLQFGLTGIVNFGVVGFYGIGMYGLGVLMIQLGLPFIAALIVAVALSALAGLFVGWIVLDLDEQAALVATLAFAQIVFYLVTTEKWLTEGVVGLGSVPFPFDFGSATEPAFLGLLILLAVAIMAYARRVRGQPYGRLLIGIRDNEGLARTLGKRTFRQKLVLFTITCAGMGLFGALSASLQHFLQPNMLSATLTFAAWIALILGGKRHWAGGLVGAVLILTIFDVLIGLVLPIPRQYQAIVPDIKYMLYGLLLIVVIMFRPQGILGEYTPRRASGGEVQG